MAANCCNMKAGAFFAAAFNLLVGGMVLGGAIYKIVIKQTEAMGLLVIMFLMSLLLIHNGILLIIGIVMQNKEYVVLYLILNIVNWLIGTFIILKEISSKLPTAIYASLSLLLIVAWSIQLIVYFFYKQIITGRFTEKIAPSS